MDTKRNASNTESSAPAAYNPLLDPESLLTTSEHADLRSCSTSTIRRERNERRGVPFTVINHNVVRYRRGDILEYINSFKKVRVSNPDIKPLCGPGKKRPRREGARVQVQS